MSAGASSAWTTPSASTTGAAALYSSPTSGRPAIVVIVIVVILAIALAASAMTAQAASHREAPQIATDPTAESGQFIGPDGRGEMKGHPRLVRPVASAEDPARAAAYFEAFGLPDRLD